MDLEHERRLTEIEERSKSNSHRLDDVEKRQDTLDELVGTVKVLATREETIETDVKEIKGEVKALTLKPAKRWESLSEKVLWAIIAAILGYAMAHIGL